MNTPRKLPAKDNLIQTLSNLLHTKSFDKISVNELCETAQVSRSSFYANYEDKYHLLACCLDRFAEALNMQMASCPPERFHVNTLDFIQKNNRFFYHAFGADLNEESIMILFHFFEQHFSAVLAQKAEEGVPLPGPLEVVSSFYVGGLVFSTLRWIKDGYRLPKEEVAAAHCALLRDIL